MKIKFSPEQCIGCGSCVMACIDQNDTPIADGATARMHIREIYTIKNGRGNVSYAKDGCVHCPSMACAKQCPTGAIKRDETTQFVWIDHELCINCGKCKDACPFHAIDFSMGMPDKCDGCYQRVAQGYEPACVRTCLTQALRLEKD
ncbi:4Fe-4S dicluster domain-containing protein [Bengtsoniella intestinalis]|uniref:4Fe-4S dicluster domain-containing protein n=1 Tax=Bengtsoniella intestinalis TaxID=3073143 RepID=UPI00391FBB52